VKKSYSHFLLIGILVFAICALMPITSFAADVDVYAEGAYEDNNLDLYVYADINADPILSFGFKLTWDAVYGLSVMTAEKNKAVWELEVDDPDPDKGYLPDPDFSVPCQVVIIGGRSMKSAPTAGVTGQRVLLAKVAFTRTGMDVPIVQIGLSEGLPPGGSAYDNFVTNQFNGDDPEVLDNGGGGFFVTIAQRGDANADGNINISDVTKIREMIFDQIPKTCYADCNNDGDVNISDVTCIREKIFQ